MMNKLLWRMDVLIYRLFYWRWSPRLKRDPDLAYLFSKLSAGWTNANPPQNPKAVDVLIAQEFLKYGKLPNYVEDASAGGLFITNK